MSRVIEDKAADAVKPVRPIGATIFMAVLALAMIGYAVSVVVAARGATDWMMVAPVAAVGVLALGFAVMEDWREAFARAAAGVAAKREGWKSSLPALGFMALLVAYVAATPFVGFDLATMVFVVASLILQGERRPLVVAGIGIAASLAIVWLFVHVFAIALPTLFL
ncbi:hypothetical protein GTW25_16710 [Aliihoeflea aestuarii]|jgi:hypothetical protein|uniref:tripartite tricarboxylate transporter TctB family protein n=1 Tax=Aliihoeflea aestuarii TaxID=453840 RepID=UPI00209470BC|nr:tripartite tricarboxylate transporter TctB family protein [Aliihoeflea aestuarii]MCO6392668.1 hypothetical protein [Aliihoeflea aestuarii]